MARDSERLLKAVVTNYSEKGDGFFIKNSANEDFVIPEGTFGSTSFLGWGNNQKITFEIGTGSKTQNTRQISAILRFTKDFSNVVYGYVLSGIKLYQDKELSAGSGFTPSDSLTAAALGAAREYYIHACTRGTGGKDSALATLQRELKNSLVIAQNTREEHQAFSRQQILKARYAQASTPGRADAKAFDEQVRRSLVFSREP